MPFHIDLKKILKSLDLTTATDIVTTAYYDQGYTGNFGTQTFFEVDVDSSNKPFAVLHTPDYTPYMLYGRGPGRMPPAEPIDDWMARKGLTGSSWAIRRHISEFGVEGNNFLEPVMPEAKKAIVNKMTEAITAAIAKKLV